MKSTSHPEGRVFSCVRFTCKCLENPIWALKHVQSYSDGAAPPVMHHGPHALPLAVMDATRVLWWPTCNRFM